MLALVLIEAGIRPSFIIGGDVNEIGTGAAWDTGDLLVVEADESDGTFTELDRDAVVVTSVEPDHLEHYGGFEPLVEAFERFVKGCAGPAVVCADDEGAMALATRTDATTYGTGEHAQYRMVDVDGAGAGSAFDVVHEGVTLGRVRLPVPGLHNARNACAALVTGLLLGASFDEAARALARFAGVARRFEFRGEAGGVTFVDDYAHLPTEVKAALQAARQGDWRRVVCVFQPHRYSRTASLWPAFADAFDECDLLVVTDIYPAGEAPRPGVSGKLVVDAVLGHRPWHHVAYLPRRTDVVGYLRQVLRPGDLCLTLGAGDLTSLPDELLPTDGS
jgi:UDP-N-acetylmuramate--alanine ligase